MEVVRDYDDVIKIGNSSSIIIWGAGELGIELMCKLNLAGFTDYYVSDSNYEVKSQIDNYVYPADIMCITKRQYISIILAVKSDKAVKDIIENISNVVNGIQGSVVLNTYRYVPETIEEMIIRRKEQGFFNGYTYRKVVGNDKAIDILEGMILGEEPFLFSRWGTIEGDIVYFNKARMQSSLKLRLLLQNNAGVFPITESILKSYCHIMECAATEIDMLCAFYWQKNIEKWIEWYSPDATIVGSELEYPFFSNPWTKALKGMKVLVIHPFAKLIDSQYRNRDKLFSSDDVLPEFELITYQAVQSMGGNHRYKDWIEALNIMQDAISKIDFEIALIGCGAYGMPLGAFIKSKMQKKAIHMGGSLQILFGIKGKRWESEGYNYQHKLYNKYWVRPSDDLKPQNYKDVEDGCYW